MLDFALFRTCWLTCDPIVTFQPSPEARDRQHPRPPQAGIAHPYDRPLPNTSNSSSNNNNRPQPSKQRSTSKEPLQQRHHNKVLTKASMLDGHNSPRSKIREVAGAGAVMNSHL